MHLYRHRIGRVQYLKKYDIPSQVISRSHWEIDVGQVIPTVEAKMLGQNAIFEHAPWKNLFMLIHV